MPKIELKYEFTLSGLINIIVVVVGGTIAYTTLINAQAKDASDIKQMQPEIASLQEVSPSTNVRLTVLESRAETSAVQVLKLTEAIETMTEKLQVTSENAASANRGVEYIRDWVRDLKQQQQKTPTP